MTLFQQCDFIIIVILYLIFLRLTFRKGHNWVFPNCNLISIAILYLKIATSGDVLHMEIFLIILSISHIVTYLFLFFFQLYSHNCTFKSHKCNCFYQLWLYMFHNATLYLFPTAVTLNFISQLPFLYFTLRGNQSSILNHCHCSSDPARFKQLIKCLPQLLLSPPFHCPISCGQLGR